MSDVAPERSRARADSSVEGVSDVDLRDPIAEPLALVAIAQALIYIGDELRAAREARAREIGGGPDRGDF